jgi:nitroreductase
METWRAIDSIRVVRDFADKPIEAKHLERILHAGRRAGSSKNLQRWAFIVVRDRDRLKQLTEVGPFAGHIAGAYLAIALVTPDPNDQPLSVVFDVGRAAQNMVLVAWEFGIGSVPATVYEHSLAAELLGLPAGQHCEYILSFGYPADPSVLTTPKQAGGRKRPIDVIHEERW